MTFGEERAHLIITKLCNNNCTFCFNKNKKMNRKYGTYDRSMDEIIKDVDVIASKTNYIVITGGEPTIKKDFFNIIRYAKEKGIIKAKIMTNGRKFSSPTFCKELEKIKDIQMSFNVTILGSNKGIHDGISGRGGSFNETIEGIKNLIKLGKEVTTHTPITKDNYQDIVNISKILASLKVNQQAYSLAFNVELPKVNFVLMRLREIKAICQKNKINLRVGGFPFCMVNNMDFFSCNNNIKLYDKNYYFRDERDDRIKKLTDKSDPSCNICELRGYCSINWIEPEKLIECKYNPLNSRSTAETIISSI